MTMLPTAARAPITAQGAPILRPNPASPIFGSRLEPQILRTTPVQILRTTPAWPPAGAGAAMSAAAPLGAAQAVAAQQAAQAVAAQQAAQAVAAQQAAAMAAPGLAASPSAPAGTPPGATSLNGAATAGTLPAGTLPAGTLPVVVGAASPAATPATPTTHAPPTGAPLAAPLVDGGPPLGPEEFVPVPGEMTFAQFLQGLNPLHHLPGVGTIYRAVTGAEVHPVMRVLGGAVMGGPVGMIIAAIGAAFEQTQPLERLGHTLAGRPDPNMPAANSTAARAAAAYARFGGAS